MADKQVLILGIGNVLWADEGFGIRVVETLNERFQFPDNVEVMDGGTQGIYLVQHVQKAGVLVVFDAIDYGLALGAMKQIYGDAVPKFMGAKKMSLHQTGFQEVLAMAELTGGAGADISVEAAGYPDALNNSLKHVNQDGGKVIIFGIQGGGGDGTVPLVFRGLFREGITVIPTQGAASPDAIDHIQTMIELKQRGWWDPGEMVTHRMSFDNVKEAYDMYENIDDNVVKVVMGD